MIDQEKLHNQCLSDNSEERIKAFNQLINRFSSLPDKQQAWNDLINLTNNQLINDEDSLVRYRAASALGSAFSHLPDKQQAWNDLHELTNDEDSSVRSSAASALGFAFSYVPDKQQAWSDLNRLTNDEDWTVRYRAASALGSTFSHVPDKQQAWSDLHRLTNDEDHFVRSGAASTLGSAFSHVPDKQQAWSDLNRLISDEDQLVRYRGAFALGSAFPNVPDKNQAWNDLHKLTIDEDIRVRAYANHSFGKISIFKASQAENEEVYKEELEKAISFFEKASEESLSGLSNPAQFCLPFYRSFHTILFKKQEAKGEIDKCLAEAKDAVKGSKSKEMLFEAVDNLANALKEVQNLENLGLEAKKCELDFYIKYCDCATELMIEAEDVAPFAIRTIRKGLPIIDRNLKELLEEIQEKARIDCKELQGTPKAEIACKIYGEVQKLVTGNPEEASQNIEDIGYFLKRLISDVPENEYVLNKIDLMINENDIAKKTQVLKYVIGCTGQMLKENKVSVKIDGSSNNVIVYSKDSNISVFGDVPKPPNFFRIPKLILEHPIISTVIGGIILAFIQKKYFF